MIRCPHCDEPIVPDAARCPNCLRWFADRLIARIRHPEADAREAAVRNLVFVDRTAETVDALADVLADALADPAVNVRRAAGRMLFIVGEAAGRAVPALTAALEDGDDYVRRAAAAALSNVDSPGPSATAKLAELMETDDDLLRAWVAEALRTNR